MGAQSLEMLALTDARWQALVRRDAASDFLYAVRTTGVYCRPSCASRRPKRQNVELFVDVSSAERAGYRACLRCAPTGETWIERACRLLDAEPSLDLRSLADALGKSPFHVQRAFKEALGVSPHAYAKERRRARAREALRRANSVTAAIFDAGYDAAATFYADAAESGMKPAAERRGGAGEVVRFALGAHALGAVLVATTERGVCAVSLGDEPEALLRALEASYPNATLVAHDDATDGVVSSVLGALDEPERARTLPLDLRGTAFRRRVWEALRAIPAGRTATYAEVARTIGAPTAVRAVASACANNPVAVLVPCHRVVRSDGGLAGYRWGIDRKRALLLREGSLRS